MRFFLLTTVFFIQLLALRAHCQFSLCGQYDVFNTHPDELRTELVIRCMHLDDSLYVDGPIDSELIFELDHNRQKPLKYLFLNSFGGRVSEALKLAEFIRSNNIITILRKGAKCFSACTLLFQAGVERLADPKALLMFHSARYLFESEETKMRLQNCEVDPKPKCLRVIAQKRSELTESTNQLFAAYQLYGMSSAFFQDYHNLATDPLWYEKGNYLKKSDWFLSPLEAMGYNIVTAFL